MRHGGSYDRFKDVLGCSWAAKHDQIRGEPRRDKRDAPGVTILSDNPR
jgi:hypothetical protein